MNERTTEQAMREAFAKKCPEDDVMLRLAEDNQDFWLDAINARHALARFREGWLAAQVSIATPQPQPQTVRGALKKAVRLCDEEGGKLQTDDKSHDYWMGVGDTVTACENSIRALIEPLSADEHKEHQDKDHDLIALRASRKVMALNNEPVMPTSQLQARIQCIIYDAIKELP